MSSQRPSVHIEDLLGPTSNNLLKGHLLRDNEELSMRIVTQDAFGWQNWMEANSLSIEGSAQDIVFQAGQKVGWQGYFIREEALVWYEFKANIRAKDC